MRDSIRWRIMVPYALIILMTTLGLTLYISTQVRRARREDLQARLLSDARLMANTIAPLLERELDVATVAAIDAQARRWGVMQNERITVVAPDGTVLGESHTDRTLMDNHLYRPEIQEALREGSGVSVRFSATLDYSIMYAAAPIRNDAGETLGIVRVSLPLDRIAENVDHLSRTILLAGVVAGTCAVLLALYIAERTIEPIRRLISVVEQVAEGDLNARLLSVNRDEVGQLTRAFNHMADQLRNQVSSLAQERSRLSTVLTTMADGVIITDERGEVLLMNPSAARILNIDRGRAVGRTFAQVVYNHQLIDLWNRCYQSGTEQTETVETVPRGTFLQAFMTPLEEIESPRILVILQDLTQVRRLETVRRDFISNISHELRTPLASLMAVVETLKDGAIEEPPVAQRFLTHMENELNSLTQMVQELLELSRIESGRVPLQIQPTDLYILIHSPVERLRPQAERVGLHLHVSLPEAAPAVRADAERIHQVVTNLVHNAIKFTAPGGVVTIFARAEEDEVVIAVTDTGVGILEEDLPRIFERFYKADRARSGGGTGLGLAIVKHIVQGHKGRVWAESIEGVGSTFYFSLPRARQSRAETL